MQLSRGLNTARGVFIRRQLLVHAALTMTRAYYDQVVQELDGMGLLPTCPLTTNCNAAAF